MKTAHTVLILFVLCPNCKKSEHRIDHIKIGQEAGPWFCHEDDCGCGFRIKRVSATEVQTELVNETTKDVFILLQYCDDPNLQIIVGGIESKYEDGPDWLIRAQEDPDGHNEYFYNEHTCPTNYLLGVEVINYKGDTDPHGVFKYVRRLSDKERQEILDSRKMPWQLEQERKETQKKLGA